MLKTRITEQYGLQVPFRRFHACQTPPTNYDPRRQRLAQATSIFCLARKPQTVFATPPAAILPRRFFRYVCDCRGRNPRNHGACPCLTPMDDFADLRKAGLPDPMMAEIEKKLGVSP